MKRSLVSDSVYALSCLDFSLFTEFFFFVSFVLFIIYFLLFAYLCVMEGDQGGSSSEVDARIESVRSDVKFGQGYGGRPQQRFQGEQDALATVPR